MAPHIFFCMEYNYTPLSHTPLVIDELRNKYKKTAKRNSIDSVFLSLSVVTMMTLATIIYTIFEKKFITGL